MSVSSVSRPFLLGEALAAFAILCAASACGAGADDPAGSDHGAALERHHGERVARMIPASMRASLPGRRIA